MAEEEILTEAAPPSKKSSGGGFSIVHLAIIAVLLIIGTAATVLLIQRSVGNINKEVSSQIGKIRQQNETGRIAAGSVKMEDCSLTAQLASMEKPLIINMADGQSYMSVGITVCLATDPKEAAKNGAALMAEFDAKKDMVVYVCNEYLSRLTKGDLFPAAGGASNVAPNDDLAAIGFDDEPQDFSRRMDSIRGELLQMFQQRQIWFVKDLYFTSFLVQ
ncbi:MAG TPA: flagellar basal body-associated FliL family protein [bacterium]|nr:flagellar basal body-associated FliL family protein [bacterium]HPN94593.1 flagellar basal body-associated FliL family protein [bacterium]